MTEGMSPNGFDGESTTPSVSNEAVEAALEEHELLVSAAIWAPMVEEYALTLRAKERAVAAAFKRRITERNVQRALALTDWAGQALDSAIDRDRRREQDETEAKVRADEDARERERHQEVIAQEAEERKHRKREAAMEGWRKRRVAKVEEDEIREIRNRERRAAAKRAREAAAININGDGVSDRQSSQGVDGPAWAYIDNILDESGENGMDGAGGGAGGGMDDEIDELDMSPTLSMPDLPPSSSATMPPPLSMSGTSPAPSIVVDASAVTPGTNRNKRARPGVAKANAARRKRPRLSEAPESSEAGGEFAGEHFEDDAYPVTASSSAAAIGRMTSRPDLSQGDSASPAPSTIAYGQDQPYGFQPEEVVDDGALPMTGKGSRNPKVLASKRWKAIEDMERRIWSPSPKRKCRRQVYGFTVVAFGNLIELV